MVAVVHAARETDLAMLAAGHADILLSGHDHDLVLHYDGRCVLAESSSDAHYVTAIDLFVTIATAGPKRIVSWRPRFRIHDSSTVAPDPETLSLVRRLEDDLSQRLDVPIGRIEAPLDSRIAAVRAREASFGNLVADALRAATGADIAVMNGGGIRGNRFYAAGTVLTRRDILTELPFGNTLVLVAITGVQVRALLEADCWNWAIRPAASFQSRLAAGGSRRAGGCAHRLRPRSATHRSTKPAPTGWHPTISSMTAATATACLPGARR